ncbi:fibronectin type III domain-containing protein, partial [candidate division KSB1 bacterium]
REAPDEIPPEITSLPLEENVSQNSATIRWPTNESATSKVKYGTDPSNLDREAGSDDYVKVHKVNLTNLESDQQYYVAVISKDLSKNEVNTYDNLLSFFTEPEPDILPPEIGTPVVIDIKHNAATIQWTTNEPANTSIKWGTSVNYGVGSASDSEFLTDRAVILTNLVANRDYYVHIKCADIKGNVAEASENPIRFHTPISRDRNPPRITAGPYIENRTTKARRELTLGKNGEFIETVELTSEVTIEWSSDEPSDGYVLYGFTPDSLIYSEGSTDLKLEHSVTLTNLIPNTEYHYIVTSTDLGGNKVEKTRIIDKFRTPRVEDKKQPVIIEGPIVYFTERSASFEWVTDEPSNSIIYYGIADSVENGVRYRKTGSSDAVVRHNVVITNLIQGEEYIFVITSEDRSGNMVTFPTDYQGSLYKTLSVARSTQPPGGTGRFRTRLQADNTAPIIISPPSIVNKTATSVTIEWTTDEQSNSIVDYDTTQTYSLSKQSGSNVIDHSVTLTNLEPATTYNYRIGSTDINKNGPSYSLNAAVTTLAETDIIPPQIIAGPEITAITDKQATIIWETDEPSDSHIEFSLDSTFGVLDTISGAPETKTLAEDVTLHRITLTNLIPDTTYYFRVASVDLEDNGPTTSADKLFKTAAMPDVTPPQFSDTVRVVSSTDRTATINWWTDELSDSFVLFSDSASFQKRNALRKGTNYYDYDWENNIGSARDVIDHTITLTNLEPDATYIFTTGSVDKSNNVTHAPDMYLFKTSAAPDSISPEVPEISLITGGNNEAYIQWSAVPNAAGDLSGYNVYRKEGSQWQAIATQEKNTFYYDTGLENDTMYEYYITSVDNVYPPNESDSSISKSTTASADSVPSAPVILSPSEGALIENTLKPVISFQNSISSKDSLTYTIAIAYDSTFLNLAVYKTDISEGQTTTEYSLETALDNNTTCYCRIRGN